MAHNTPDELDSRAQRLADLTMSANGIAEVGPVRNALRRLWEINKPPEQQSHRLALGERYKSLREELLYLLIAKGKEVMKELTFEERAQCVEVWQKFHDGLKSLKSAIGPDALQYPVPATGVQLSWFEQMKRAESPSLDPNGQDIDLGVVAARHARVVRLSPEVRKQAHESLLSRTDSRLVPNLEHVRTRAYAGTLDPGTVVPFALEEHLKVCLPDGEDEKTFGDRLRLLIATNFSQHNIFDSDCQISGVSVPFADVENLRSMTPAQMIEQSTAVQLTKSNAAEVRRNGGRIRNFSVHAGTFFMHDGVVYMIYGEKDYAHPTTYKTFPEYGLTYKPEK